MKIGVVFPQTEIGPDPTAVRDYAQAAEDLGYTHLLAYDHVVGADPNRPDGQPWRGPYTVATLFHEPLVLFAYLGAITKSIEFVSGIIILPQRQAVLVAKQAAEVDVLTGGRLRLGVAVGWNQVEYEALGETWENRGRRIVEQVAVMRALWTQEVVDFHGRWHNIIEGRHPAPARAAADPGLVRRHVGACHQAHRPHRRRLVPPVPPRRRRPPDGRAPARLHGRGRPRPVGRRHRGPRQHRQRHARRLEAGASRTGAPSAPPTSA